jgi:SsrA-binding protein
MRIVNRKYNREYTKLETFEAGIALTGAEVKSVRAEQIKIDDAFVKIMQDGAYLINAEIQVYKFARPAGYDPRRSRKLLLHKKELLHLKVKLSGSPGLTIVPLACYNKGHLFKLEIALSRGRRDVEKRKLEKARDVTRAIDKEIKNYMKH